MFDVVFSILLLAPAWLCAQVPPHLPPGMAAQFQVAQPSVDVEAPVNATAAFDPPVAHVGEKVYYRVTLDATEASIHWPEKITAPAELKLGADARGQIMEMQPNQVRPTTVFLYELQATALGRFSIPNFGVEVYGRRVEVPAADLEVVAAGSPAPPPPRQLLLEVSPTNAFVGQPLRVRVMLPASPANQVEAVREVQLNGDGFLADKTAVRQSIAPIQHDGQQRPTYIFETTVTPIAVGPLKLFAQGFTAGREFSGPIVITAPATLPGGQAKYNLLVSDSVAVNVRPLPLGGERPGFTGSIGRFIADPPGLSTNRIRMGEPVQLKAPFNATGELARFVPPEPPRSRDWQIIADDPPDGGFTLIPLTDDARQTPAIPFSAFDPASEQYIDLTIPPQPVTIVSEGLPVELPALDTANGHPAQLKLSDLASSPGKMAGSLRPPQFSGWLVGAQFLPVFGFLALWQWDRRRRFLEAHPEIVRCRKARRALRRQKRKLRKAADVGDAAAFVRHAADAMKIACAPHFPAHPQALVCGDVLTQLDGADQNGRSDEIIRKIFAAADAQFAAEPSGLPVPADALAWKSDVETLLQSLEAKL